MARKKYTEDFFDLEEDVNHVKKENKSDKNKSLSSITLLITVSSVLFVYICYLFINGVFEKTIAKETSLEILYADEDIAVSTINAPASTENILIETVPETVDNSKSIDSLINLYGNNDITLKLDITNSSGNEIFSTPVAKTVNNTFYLDHDLYKNINIDGSPFLDSNLDLSNYKNISIYASNSLETSPFYFLENYLDYKYFNENKTITISEKNATTVFDVFAFCKIDSNFKTEPINFDDASFPNYIDNIYKNNVYYDENINIDSDDTLISIVSTSNLKNKSRYILYGKKRK